MKSRSLGQSGIQASVIGFGAWAIGGWLWGGTNEPEAVRAIQASLDAGINLIDTAPAYGLGLSEELVGKAIAGKREKVVLATKCGLVWHTKGGNFFFQQGGRAVHRFLGKDSIRHEVEQSLRRLRTDYIDLYQTHWQDPTTPIAETAGALMELKREGKIRSIGVSNATVGDIREYLKAGPLDCDQEKFSLLDREEEEGKLPFLQQQGMAFLAYSPLARGLLTGKMGPERVFAQGDQRRDLARFSVEARQKVAVLLKQIAPIAKNHQLTMGQLVLAWTLSRPGVTHVLVGARNPKQAVENARAVEASLSAPEIEAISSAAGDYASGI